MEAGSRNISPELHAHSPGCTDDIVTSDHSPVFGTFEVGVTSQFISKKGDSYGYTVACICVGTGVAWAGVHMCFCTYMQAQKCDMRCVCMPRSMCVCKNMFM